jgi:hypothetical protein
MMKSRTLFFIAAGLLILGIAIFTFSARNRVPAQAFPATINRDCAPWDGSAFTISMRYDSKTTITVSIWQAPEINVPTTFTFPDDTGQVGTAYILPELDPFEQLNGTVTFLRVGPGMPVEGRFSLTSTRGGEYVGQFVAVWESQIALCG